MEGKKLSRNELVNLVHKIKIDDFLTEKHSDEAIDIFMHNVPDPEAPNLIFQNKPELTPEEIVDKALSYQPIIMPAPSDD